MESPFRTLKLLFSGICRNTGSDITVMAETNNVRRFYFQKRSHTNTFTVELRDLFVSSAIKCTLTLDSFGENFSKQLTLGMILYKMSIAFFGLYRLSIVLKLRISLKSHQKMLLLKYFIFNFKNFYSRNCMGYKKRKYHN